MAAKNDGAPCETELDEPLDVEEASADFSVEETNKKEEVSE